MIWIAFIVRPVVCSNEIEYECKVEKFDLPNTTRADMRVAILHAAKRFRVKQDCILCIPEPRKQLGAALVT